MHINILSSEHSKPVVFPVVICPIEMAPVYPLSSMLIVVGDWPEVYIRFRYSLPDKFGGVMFLGQPVVHVGITISSGLSGESKVIWPMPIMLI